MTTDPEIAASFRPDGQGGSEIINLTPHPVIIRDAAGTVMVRLEPSGRLARVAEVVHPDGTIAVGGVTVPAEVRSYGAVEGLPAVPDGTAVYVVPLLTALAAKAAGRDTSDLLVPGAQTRGSDGTVNGCRTLGRLA